MARLCRILKIHVAFFKFFDFTVAYVYFFLLFLTTFNLFLNSFFDHNFVYMNNEEIRKRIKDRRKEQQMSQAELAERMSISQTAYYKIEKGETHLISDHLSKLASILDVPEEELLLGFDVASYTDILREKDKRIADLEKIIEDKDKIIRLQEELLRKK